MALESGHKVWVVDTSVGGVGTTARAPARPPAGLPAYLAGWLAGWLTGWPEIWILFLFFKML